MDPTVGNQRKAFLDGEQDAFPGDIENRIVGIFTDLADRRVPRNARVCEQNVGMTFNFRSLLTFAKPSGRGRSELETSARTVVTLLPITAEQPPPQFRFPTAGDENIAPSATLELPREFARPIPLAPPVTRVPLFHRRRLPILHSYHARCTFSGCSLTRNIFNFAIVRFLATARASGLL